MNDQIIKNGRWGLRQRTFFIICICSVFLFSLILTGIFIDMDRMSVNLAARNHTPSLTHLFGTDWLGRDMLVRTLKGLTFSFFVGIMAALLSMLIALVLSLIGSLHRILDWAVVWLIDLFLSVPHLVVLILISFVLGGGYKGVIIALAVTHWPSLTRLLRAEIMQIKKNPYVEVSKKLGKSRIWIVKNHFLPHLIPQLLVGFILLFPHVILHEAAITFLGFGLPQEQPAIGIILSESMQYLSTGMWWLAVFPGLSLLILVVLFDLIGRCVRKLVDPFDGQMI